MEGWLNGLFTGRKRESSRDGEGLWRRGKQTELRAAKEFAIRILSDAPLGGYIPLSDGLADPVSAMHLLLSRSAILAACLESTTLRDDRSLSPARFAGAMVDEAVLQSGDKWLNNLEALPFESRFDFSRVRYLLTGRLHLDAVEAGDKGPSMD